MLICHVVSGLMYGGGQRVALDLAAQLDRRPGTSTLLVLLGGRVADGFPPIHSEWVQLEAYDGRYNRPGSLGHTARALSRVFRERRPDIAHSHGWDADVVTGLASRWCSIDHVVHQHILADWASSARPVHRARRLVSRVALGRPGTRWIAVSAAVKESLRPLTWLPTDAISVVWNGVDLDRFFQEARLADSRRPMIGTAARLAPMKGLTYLIEAVAELDRRGMPCDLKIAGDGPSRDELISLTARLGLSERVTFLGQQEDMPSFYRSIDIFALPSLAEGLPLSLLEAMATGLPVVSTTLSGIREVVESGLTGLLVPPRSSYALANALESLVRSKALCGAMGIMGRQRTECCFSLQRAVDQVAGVYAHSRRQAKSLALGQHV